MNYYRIGYIGKTHGLKGEIIVKETTDFDRFEAGNSVYVFYENKYIPLNIKSVKDYKDGLLVVFKDYENINLVEKFRSCELFIDEESREELAEDEYYFSDLVGLEIYNEQGEFRAVCSGVREVPQGHLLECVIDDKTKLIPFNSHFIVDVTDKKIIINEIKGLLWK